MIAGDAELAARLAAEHFSLTETMFRQVYATVDGGTGGPGR